MTEQTHNPRTRPIGRTTRMSLYSPGAEAPSTLGDTWLEAETFTYPSGAISAGRRAYVRLRRNEHNPIELAYGQLRVVAVGIPDTYCSIPARLRANGRTVAGYVSVIDDEYTFTPEAANHD